MNFEKLLTANKKSFRQSFERHYQYLCELNLTYEPRRYEIYYGNVSNTISGFFSRFNFGCSEIIDNGGFLISEKNIHVMKSQYSISNYIFYLIF